MDIKSILGSVSSKKGPDTDVKNRCSVGFSCEEEPSKGRDDFAKLLAEEDSKTSTLLIDTATSALATGELPQLAPQPQTFVLQPSDVAVSTSATPLVKPEALPFTLPLVKPEALPFTLSTVELAPAPVEGRASDAVAGFVVPVPLVGSHRPMSAEAGNDLEKRLTKTVPIAGATISLLAPETRPGPVLVPGKIFKPTVSTGDRKNESINESSAVAPWSLGEVGKKNEALLDVLALGGRAKQIEGQPLAAKPEAYAFQREAVVDTSLPLGQSLAPSQTLTSETSQASDKNAYWLAGGTQNVALTLGGLGEEAVAIKISVSGHETQVDIRTDQLALRQMIEGSVQEMKDQLSTEGLTLSGLSVGSTSQEQGLGQGNSSGAGTEMNRGAGTGQGMGKNNQRQASPDDSSSPHSNQTTNAQNRTVRPESRVSSTGASKLSVFA